MNHRQGLLGGSRVVEISKGLAFYFAGQYRELLADGLHIERLGQRRGFDHSISIAKRSEIKSSTKARIGSGWMCSSTSMAKACSSSDFAAVWLMPRDCR